MLKSRKNKIFTYFLTLLTFFSLLIIFPEISIKNDIQLGTDTTISKITEYLLSKKLLDNGKVHTFSTSIPAENETQADTSIKYYSIDKVVKTPLGRSNFRLGLDLQGGTYIALKADMSNISEVDKISSLQSAKKIIENRVNQFGINETNIFTSINGDDYKIIIEIPGSGVEVEEKVAALKQAANLEFWQKKTLELVDTTNLPIEYDIYLNYEKTDISGKDLKTANAIFAQEGGLNADGSQNYWIQLEFTDEGAKKFEEVARNNLGKIVAIMFDNQILSAPQINLDYFSNGGSSTRPIIQGIFGKEEANEVANLLRAGALPVPLTLAEERLIDPTLGKDALDKVFLAGGVGILALIILMIFLYKKSGIIASVALVLYVLYNLAFIKFSGITLTLAGIAGFILSVGMAVDANVLIFERIKEERKRGANLNTSIKLGFSHAWTSIKDSNTSTLITSLILFLFGSTITKGFAVNLSLGVIISMFTAIFITRRLLKK